MKRRNLLKSIVVVSAGVVVFPRCKTEPAEDPIPVFDNLAIDENQFNLLQEISERLLPKQNLDIVTPEPTNEYILNMINDCHSLEESQRYVNGLNQFSNLIQANYNKPFTELTPDIIENLFEYLSEIKNKKNPLRFFFDTTLGYTKNHFMGSEYFLTKHLDWKFLPGEYKGAEPV